VSVGETSGDETPRAMLYEVRKGAARSG